MEIHRSQEGLYEIIVAVQPEVPVVGSVHVTVTPLDAETSAPVASAEVVVTASDAEGRAAYQVRAVNSPASPRYYDANITFERAGSWTLQVEVGSDDLGRATVFVPLQVGESPLAPGIAGTVVWLAIIAVLVGGALLIWRAASRRQERRKLGGGPH